MDLQHKEHQAEISNQLQLITLSKVIVTTIAYFCEMWKVIKIVIDYNGKAQVYCVWSWSWFNYDYNEVNFFIEKEVSWGYDTIFSVLLLERLKFIVSCSLRFILPEQSEW